MVVTENATISLETALSHSFSPVWAMTMNMLYLRIRKDCSLHGSVVSELNLQPMECCFSGGRVAANLLSESRQFDPPALPLLSLDKKLNPHCPHNAHQCVITEKMCYRVKIHNTKLSDYVCMNECMRNML